MREVICKLAFLALFLFSYTSKAHTLSSDSLPTLIITKGGGGDAAGAAIIRDQWRHGTPDLVNLSQMPLDELEAGKHNCVLVIGQGAMSDVAQSGAINAKFSGKRVGLYAHLIDQNTLELLQRLGQRTALNLFFTQSQLSLLKLRNISGYRLLTSERNQVWREASQVIETVSPAKLAAGEVRGSPLIAANDVIWLGGNYTTSSGKRRLFTADEIVGALKPLQVAPARPSPLCWPRVFSREG
ncbi:hypothetical protein [Chelativorans sp. J32]|jgi:hypothetical protein|uniref:hypothetical protein n=1 Tax=Chelativorans sp. J32 TaxID=935840 RepID=UPI0004BAB695|nr:hypothetical protein [Chelativorans sp. J32]